jgi:hypothetical protein
MPVPSTLTAFSCRNRDAACASRLNRGQVLAGLDEVPVQHLDRGRLDRWRGRPRGTRCPSTLADRPVMTNRSDSTTPGASVAWEPVDALTAVTSAPLPRDARQSGASWGPVGPRTWCRWRGTQCGAAAPHPARTQDAISLECDLPGPRRRLSRRTSRAACPRPRPATRFVGRRGTRKSGCLRPGFRRTGCRRSRRAPRTRRTVASPLPPAEIVTWHVSSSRCTLCCVTVPSATSTTASEGFEAALAHPHVLPTDPHVPRRA